MANDEITNNETADQPLASMGDMGSGSSVEARGTGLLVAPEDSRDAVFGAFEEVNLGAYPERFELPWIGGIRDQGRQYSCVMQTVSRIHDYANHQAGDTRIVSARYGYAYAKIFDGQPYMNGTFTKTGFDVAIKVGISDRTAWADDANLPLAEYISRPSTVADEAAKPFRFSGYVNCVNPDQVKAYITKFNLPTSIGVNSNNTGWGRLAVKNNNNMLKEPTTSVRSGHLMACVGWEPRGWIVENSWGDDWGERGRAVVPYDYSGLQKGFYGGYDLPNNWQTINNNYQMDMKQLEANAVIYSLYRKFLGREPKAEEQAKVLGHVNKMLEGFKVGGPKGQEILDQMFAGFVPENKDAVKSGRI